MSTVAPARYAGMLYVDDPVTALESLRAELGTDTVFVHSVNSPDGEGPCSMGHNIVTVKRSLDDSTVVCLPGTDEPKDFKDTDFTKVVQA